MTHVVVPFRVGVVFSLIACLLGGLGCGKKPGPVSSSATGGTDPASALKVDPPLVVECEPGIRGGRLVISTFGGDPKTLNPITENEQSSSDITRLLFAALTTFDWEHQTASPGLAYKWEVAADQITWTWHLRKGLQWSDGAPLTADDVVFTFNEVVYNPKIPNPSADALKVDDRKFDVTKVDDHTIRVVTHAPYAPFLEFFGGIPIVPKHKLAQAVAEDRYESAYGINTPPEELVCNGPFRVKQFKSAEFTLMERNPYFFAVDRQGQQLPYFDNLVYVVVPDLNTMSLRFLAGESDVLEVVRSDEYVRFKETAAKSSGKDRFTLHELGVGPEKSFFWFNLNPDKNPKTGKLHVEEKKQKWFQNVKFRQALAHAVDRDSIIKAVYAGRAEALFGFVSPVSKNWFNPNTPQYPFDPAKARAILKEIGIEDRNGDGLLEDSAGNVIEFTMHTNTGNNERAQIGVIIQEDLKRLGIKVNFQPLDFNTLVDKIDVSYDYDCILLSLGGGAVDPIASMNVLKSSGFTHFWYPKQKQPATPWEARIDELMNAQGKLLDQAARKKLYDEVQVIMNEQVPFIYTVSRHNYSAIRSNIGNVRPTVLSSNRLTWNAEELYRKK